MGISRRWGRGGNGRRAAATAVIAGGLVVGGCVGPFDTSDFMEFVPPESLVRDIDQVRLEDRSTADPVTVDEGAAAARAALEQLPDFEPPARMDLSREGVRAAALANNLDLQVQLISPSIAQTSVDEEDAKFESVFRTSAFYSVTDSPTDVATEGTQSNFTRVDVGVDIPLRTGGTVNVNFPFTRNSTNNPFSTLNPSYTNNLAFSFSQPLLRNAGNRVNTYSIRVAKYNKQITDAQTKLEAIRILANADRAYWVHYASQRALEVTQMQYELAQTQLQRARRQVQAGISANIEVLRAESGLAARLESIIIAANEVRRTRRDVKRIMNEAGLGMGTETAFVLTTEPAPLGLELSSAELIDDAVANRMEMLELEIQLALDASTIDFRRNQTLPLITFDYTYNVNGLDTSYRRALDRVVDWRFADYSLGVSAEIPIGNERRRAALHRAILQRVQRLATKHLRRQAIEQEVYDALDQLKETWQRILAARQDVLLQAETLEGEENQFEQGVRTSTDVLDQATRLAEAQLSEIRAITDYQIAQIDLAFATGTLLGYGKILWEPIDVPREEDLRMFTRQPQQQGTPPASRVPPPVDQEAALPAGRGALPDVDVPVRDDE